MWTWASTQSPQLPGRGRLGVGEAAGAEHGDEQLDGPQFTGAPVNQARPLARASASRMKTAAEHRVPLSDAALAVLESIPPLRDPVRPAVSVAAAAGQAAVRHDAD